MTPSSILRRTVLAATVGAAMAALSLPARIVSRTRGRSASFARRGPSDFSGTLPRKPAGVPQGATGASCSACRLSALSSQGVSVCGKGREAASRRSHHEARRKPG